MIILVTGATGFVGSRLARLLCERGERVRVLARPGGDRRNLAGLDVEIAEGDLRDADSLAAAAAGVGTLFHCAADYRLWTRDPRELYASNVEGTRRLMQAALTAGVGAVVYTSSVATLGTHPDGSPADERTPVSIDNMIGHYKRSKFLAEEVVSNMVREAGLPAIIVNPSAPVGPGDIKPTPTGRMIRDAARGRIPAYVDTGLNIVHVDDVAAGHLQALAHGQVGERYVLGGDDMSLRDILVHIAGLTGRPGPRLRLPRQLLYPVAAVSELTARLFDGREPQVTIDGLKMSRKRMYFSSDKARRELGYQPRPAREALADAVAWFAGQAA